MTYHSALRPYRALPGHKHNSHITINAYKQNTNYFPLPYPSITRLPRSEEGGLLRQLAVSRRNGVSSWIYVPILYAWAFRLLRLGRDLQLLKFGFAHCSLLSLNSRYSPGDGTLQIVPSKAPY